MLFDTELLTVGHGRVADPSEERVRLTMKERARQRKRERVAAKLKLKTF